jgi:hypothetical protein
VAVPLGPDAGGTEPFGVLDGLAGGLEALVVLAGAVVLLGGARIPRAVVRTACAQPSPGGA